MGCSLPVVLHKEVIGTFKKERRKRLEVQQPSEFRKEIQSFDLWRSRQDSCILKIYLCFVSSAEIIANQVFDARFQWFRHSILCHFVPVSMCESDNRLKD